MRNHFFPTGTTFTQLYMWWLRPLLCCGEYKYDCKLKKIREMLLTTLAHNQNVFFVSFFFIKLQVEHTLKKV